MAFPLRTYDEGRTVGVNYTYSNTGSEPISAADVKSWSKIDTADDDSLIGDLITETIDVVENQYNFTIVDKTVTETWESYARSVSLPFGPVKEITTVKRIDHEGTETTLTENEDYRLIGDDLIFEEVFQYESPYYRMKLEVVYTTGWATLPTGIKLGLKKAILSHYEDRQDSASFSVSELPNSSKRQFENYRNY